jgi:hypothetical protein
MCIVYLWFRLSSLYIQSMFAYEKEMNSHGVKTVYIMVVSFILLCRKFPNLAWFLVDLEPTISCWFSLGSSWTGDMLPYVLCALFCSCWSMICLSFIGMGSVSLWLVSFNKGKCPYFLLYLTSKELQCKFNILNYNSINIFFKVN